MPLRDHFRSPLDDKHSWDELHGGWPMVMVQQLVELMQEPYFAAPGVHLGSLYEVDVGTYRDLESHPESDIEGCAAVGDRVYWITSHGRNARGKDAPNRERFFATTFTVTNGAVKMSPIGRPCAVLLNDLIRDARLSRFNLAGASLRAPKAPGALNIEGLASTPEGHLLIGFRNPIPRGRALFVPLLNPAEVITGQPAKFGEPILLDLGGYGVRSIGRDKDNYLIIAGSYNDTGESRAYTWAGGSAPPVHLAGVSFPGVNPEGVAYQNEQGKTEFFIVSDDGTLKIGGVECKRLKDPSQRQFRGYTLLP